MVCLVQPNYHFKKDEGIWTVNPPLGLCYLAAVLEENKIPVKIIDAHLKNLSPQQTVALIKKSKAKYVGFSILTPAADWCAETVKRLPANMVKIAGGPHASALPEETLKAGFDIVVRGEGEMALLAIAKGNRLKNIKGIVYQRGRLIQYTSPQPLLDPNSLPLPARHLIFKGGTDQPYLSSGTRYFPWSPLFTSRGCPYNCYFCNKNVFGFSFRPRTAENVLAEIDLLVTKYKVKEIDIYDDCFNFDIKRAEKIMDLIIERGYKIYLRFSNGIRADKVSKRLLKKMKQAGTDYIAYGIESGDSTILKQIPKGETLSQIKKAVRLADEVGIPVTGFFIFGLLGDTQKTMQKTINFALSLPLERAIFNIAAPYPGTRMWETIRQKNGRIFLRKWQDFSHTSGRMHYTLPGMVDPSEVEKMYRWAHLAFYFRPRYLLKNWSKFFSPNMWPIIYRGLKRIIYAQR